MRLKSSLARFVARFIQFLLMTIGTLTLIWIVGILLNNAPPQEEAPLLVEVSDLQMQTNPQSLITIQSADQIAETRRALTRSLFGTDTLDYTRLPDSVELDVTDPIYSNFESIKQVNRLTIRMDFGIESHVLLLIPYQPRNILIVYGYGHTGQTPDAVQNIVTLIDQGYTVMAVSMPLVAPNNQPTVTTDFGKVVLSHHFMLWYLEQQVQQGKTTVPRGSILYVFVEPILASLNLVANDYKYVVMMGISGGGWTTMLYSALDTRILRSFPVAGGLPMYLRRPDDTLLDPVLSPDIGDFEQWYLPLSLGAHYLDLFVMGASGAGRGQLQVFNLYDSCCFAGTRALSYEEAVQPTVKRLGEGDFRVYIASSTVHEITSESMNVILEDIEAIE